MNRMRVCMCVRVCATIDTKPQHTVRCQKKGRNGTLGEECAFSVYPARFGKLSWGVWMLKIDEFVN